MVFDTNTNTVYRYYSYLWLSETRRVSYCFPISCTLSLWKGEKNSVGVVQAKPNPRKSQPVVASSWFTTSKFVTRRGCSDRKSNRWLLYLELLLNLHSVWIFRLAKWKKGIWQNEQSEFGKWEKANLRKWKTLIVEVEKELCEKTKWRLRIVFWVP